MKMKIKLDPGAYAPERAHATDAGLDLRCMRPFILFPRQFTMQDPADGSVKPVPICETIDTGVHIELPPGFYGKVESKSGLNVNHGIVSCGGVIDEGYTGSIKVKLYNLGPKPYVFKKGDKIAQLIIQPYAAPEMVLVAELEPTERGDNGFGSTGK